MRMLAFAASLAAALPVFADEDGHDADDHLAESGGVRILHAWTTPETDDGAYRIYLEIENVSGGEITLLGGGTEDGGTAELVGLNFAEGGSTEPLGAFPIPAESELALEPDALFLSLTGLATVLSEGDELDMHLDLEPIGAIEIHVDVEATGTTRHPHAGHNH